MKKLLIAFATMLLSLTCSAQAFHIKLGGVVTDYVSGEPLQGASVALSVGGDTLTAGTTRKTGVYSVELVPGKPYMLTYTAPGRVTRRVDVDTRNIPYYPDVPLYMMTVEVGLFDSIPDFDFSVFEEPAGRAEYKNSVRNMSWENAYSDSIRKVVDPVLADYVKRLNGYSGVGWLTDAWTGRDTLGRDTVAQVAPDPLAEEADTSSVWEDPEPAPARPVETVPGLFYTVQVGAYDNMVPLSEILGIGDLNTEPWKGGVRRYTTGVFATVEEAEERLEEVRPVVPDAFVTAYFEGKRISLKEARLLED